MPEEDSLGFNSFGIKNASRERKTLSKNVFAALYAIINLDILNSNVPEKYSYSGWFGTDEFKSDWTLGVFSSLAVLKHLRRSGALCSEVLCIFEKELIGLVSENKREGDNFILRCVCQNEFHADKADIDDQYKPAGSSWPEFIMSQMQGAPIVGTKTYPIIDSNTLGDSEGCRCYYGKGAGAIGSNSTQNLDGKREACGANDSWGGGTSSRNGGGRNAYFTNIRPVAALDSWSISMMTGNSGGKEYWSRAEKKKHIP
jgi:hypothetical protein